MQTRSQRRQQAQEQQIRPSYPQITTTSFSPGGTASAPASVFQSSNNVASVYYQQQQEQAQAQGMLQTQAGQLPAGLASAPLPSPSGNQPASYFGSLAAGPGVMGPTSHPAAGTQYAHHQQQQQLYGRHPSLPQQPGHMVSGYLGQRGDGGGLPETAPFLKDFNLVAEAAKRAQMACLTRDLGDVGL